MGIEKKDGSERYFPDDHCERCFAEFSIWTSVQDCLGAARYLERRPEPGDVFDRRLIVPFLDSDAFQGVAIKCFAWLISAYRVPESKIHMATLMDPRIQNPTVEILRNVKFRPNISLGAAGSIHRLAPALSHLNDQRFLLIEDEPHIIETIQNPIRCLLDLISRFWPTATKMREMIDRTSDGSKGPTVFHQPYTDGSLAALVEALVFYVHGLDLGPRFSASTHEGINRGFRSVEVVGHPPIDSRLIDIAQELTEGMFREIA